MIETDVLIVGSGPAGSSMAALLSSYGVDNTLVTKYRWLSDTPRAHITNQRTMEIMRDLGLEDQCMMYATGQKYMGNNVFCTSLSGEELGRVHTWGNHPMSFARHRLASPCEMNDLPQNLMEPILFAAACGRGTRARLSTEYVAHAQDKDGVTSTVRDRVTGQDFKIRSKYLIGADGGNSKVAEDLGLPMHGKMGVAGSINIIIEADLSEYVAHRPSVLYWVLQPGSDVGGIGMGVVRMVRTWNEWLIIWGYDINQPEPEVTEDFARSVVYSLIGENKVPVKVKSVSTWTVNHMHALAYSRDRVFCMGDACHRHPPSNGLGSNTSIQDAYNLAWKLAHVLKGTATPKLLDSYNAERAAVGKQVVDRANKSIAEFGPIFEALGLLSTKDPELMIKNMAARKEPTALGAGRRQKLREAIAFKVYEFDCHGVEMNHRYESEAIASDGTPNPGFKEDVELFAQATSWPGAHLPHAWLERDKKRIAVMDLCGKGRFTLLTSIGGESWLEAARHAGEELRLDIATATIGPGCDAEDPFGYWAQAREIEDDGCILVRPDMFVGFRATAASRSAKTDLLKALKQILGH